MRVINTQLGRKYLPTVLIAVGVLLLAFVSAEYAQMYWKQRQLEAEWQAQQDRFLRGGPKPNEVAERGFTRISIPRIDFSAVVVEGTDRHSLLLGPGHLEGSAVPGGPGNSVITGHRDTFFRHIAELKHGDEILVQRDGRSFSYEVTSRTIVNPSNIASIQPTKDNRLTLVTCYPTYYIGPAPERLVVVSKLVGEPDSSMRPTEYATPQELPGEQ
jgi:LPXTG-site transpeptidase (sortase) family protein